MEPTLESTPRTTPLDRWLADQDAALIAYYQRALRATMFANRPEVRPAHFSRVAADEVKALRVFIRHGHGGDAAAHGARLCQMGLGEESMLALGRATRQFCLSEAPAELRFAALDTVETYYDQVIRGFIGARTAVILEEQERIRSALQRTLGRYAVQVAVAADVARAATSILDLNELLQTAVDLIRERFGLYYAGIFLTDSEQRWAYLQASSGEAGQVLLRRGHRLKVGGDSLVGWCIANGEPRIALDVGEKAMSFDTPLLTDIHSEMVIPLISRGKVIGAMAVQSRHVGAFSDQDVAVIRIPADQLANAIENARLFYEREQQITQLSTLNEVGQALSAALDLDSLLRTVHQQVGRIYEATSFSIATYDPEGDTWALVYSVEGNRRRPLLRQPAGPDLISEIIRRRTPLLLANRREQSSFFQLFDVVPLPTRIRSWMGVPLIAADKVVGVMTIASETQEDLYSEQDLVIFSTIAAQAAIAIENARLYEQLRRELLDRVRAAEELREAKETAESASRAKSTFLANMSHELRTPLTGIIGYSELLQREAQYLGYHDLVPDLRKIHTAGNHLLAIINDILDLSKIESGKMQLFLETFDVRALLDEVQVTATPLIEKNRNTLMLETTAAVGTIYSDVTKIRQVVLNLVSNAAKFTEAGRVTLRAGREQRDGKEWIRIDIADTGIGIAREQLSRLFQDFTQADASMTRKYGGTGLGLALSRRLCQMLGGDIEVVSELGVGSTFTVRFPATAEPALAPAPAADLAPPGQPAAPEPAPARQRCDTVLVIDDDPDTREFLVRCLDECGMEMVTAASGEEGLALARALKPAVITLDVLLPGMDGWAVLSTLKNDPELADIPVVMLTVVDERDKGFILGAAAYLVKPINSQRLIDVVRAYQSAGDSHRSPGDTTILIVEDDGDLRDLLQRTLEGEGWRVVTATNGREAIARAAECSPAAVLLDLLLPEIDGIQVISILRETPPGPSIPIVVLTACELSDEERSRLNRSVEQILEKGAYTLDELVRQVRETVVAHRTGSVWQITR